MESTNSDSFLSRLPESAGGAAWAVQGDFTKPEGLSIYSATKGALNSITVSLSKELGPRKIRVNALNPGMVATEGLHSSDVMGNKFEEEVLKITPLGRIGRPENIGKIAVFLATRVTGASSIGSSSRPAY